MIEDYTTFGGEVRRLREKRGWKVADLARVTGYGVVSLRQVESGLRTPSKDLATCLAQALLPEAEQPALLALAEEARQRAKGQRSVSAEGPLPPYLRPRDPRWPEAPYLAPARPPQDILGRATELLAIRERLVLDNPTVHDVPPLALTGMGGIGKTTLAIMVGRLPGIRERFPDGVLWVQLGPTPTPINLLNDWGRALGVPIAAEPSDAACARRLRSALFDRRVLLIVDDAWDAHHAELFTLAGPQGRCLVTTRDAGVAYAVATPERTLKVAALAPDAALALLRQLAPEAVARREVAARRLCERLAYLPLALTLAGRQLALDAEVPARLERRLAELETDPQARLGLVQAGARPGLAEDQPASLASILGLSVDRLDPVDQARFAGLSVFGAEPADWDIQAAAGVWACPVEEAERTVAHLVQRGLVERRDDRYRLHTLLADYAEALAGRLGL